MSKKSSEIKPMKIGSFRVDSSLGFLIQSTTKDSTQEILGYFYGISQFVLDDISKTSSATWLEKTIILFYKETPISYRIRIRGHGPGAQYLKDSGLNGKVDIEVAYPKETKYHDVSELMNAVVESGLGLTDEQNMPLFEKPVLKTPKALRKVRLEQEKSYELKRLKEQSST